MPEAQDIHGTVFKNGSATFLARVLKADGTLVRQTDLTEVKYSIYVLDDEDPDQQTAIAGHTQVTIAIADVIYDTLQTEPIWTRDAIGYNFKHVVDVSSQQAFSVAGRAYRVRYELTPVTGQIILVRFRVHAI